MKERPILMSAPMVRAILDGTKTQTRRVVKGLRADLVQKIVPFVDRWGQPDVRADGRSATNGHCPMLCPLGRVGERLWARETWAPFHVGQKHDTPCPVDDVEDADAARYAADGRVWVCHSTGATGVADDGGWEYAPHKWRPSIHMPRWASRITLEVTDVRAQRLLDISEDDARAEGLQQTKDGRWLPGPCDDPKWAFCCLWESIYGSDAFAANPWVWAVSFKKVNP
jgi:hypothetical protein